jgi:hypothetical protein
LINVKEGGGVYEVLNNDTSYDVMIFEMEDQYLYLTSAIRQLSWRLITYSRSIMAD